MPSTIVQAHLERRGTLYYWRRRWPKAVVDRDPEFFSCKTFLLLPLRTDLLRDAKALARRLTDLSDLAFAACAEKTMAISPSDMNSLLIGLCRFQIEAADLAREIAPTRTLQAAAYEQACAEAALGTLRQAILLRDREPARAPLRAVATRLGITLDETDEDYPRLALRALEAMRKAGDEILRRDRGEGSVPPRYLPVALSASPVVRPCAIPPMPSMPGPALGTTAGLAALGLRDAALPLAGLGTVSPALAAPCDDAPAILATSPMPPTAKAPLLAAAKAPVGSPTKKAKTLVPDIHDLTEAYVAARSAGYSSFKAKETPNEKAGKSWVQNSAGNVRSTGRLLAKALPVASLAEVTDEMMTRAWTLIERLPRSYGDNPNEKRSLQQIADDTDSMDAHNEALTRARLAKLQASPGKIEYQVAISRIPRVRAATIYRHMQDAQRICRFAVAKGFLDRNIMEDHIWEKHVYESRELYQEDNKREVWFDDLPALLRTPLFQEPLEEPGDPMFWAPLISVHSGLRSEEILQLATDDIRKVDGIPCFVLQKGVGQSLKSFAARRTIPVHPNLIALGLLELVELRRRQGEPRLFPWLERSAAKKTFTETFSKKFTTYREKHKIYKKGLDYHAFRTTFNQALVRVRCLDSVRQYLKGHAENDVGIRHYTPEGFATSELLEQVTAIAYDVSMVRRPFFFLKIFRCGPRRDGWAVR
jgi:integrase